MGWYDHISDDEFVEFMEDNPDMTFEEADEEFISLSVDVLQLQELVLSHSISMDIYEDAYDDLQAEMALYEGMIEFLDSDD